MKREIASSKVRIINGKEYIVERNIRLEYSGTWLNDGYTVRRGEKSEYFIGYPNDAEIEALMSK